MLDLSYKQLAPEDDVSGFNCGSEEWQREVADFLKEDALAQQEMRLNSTFLFYSGEQLVAYTTLVASNLDLEADPDRLRGLPGVSEAIGGGRRVFPAVLIAQFGVAAGLQRKGYGKQLLEWAIGHVADLGVGVRFLTLHVHRDNQQGRRFWDSQGFVRSTNRSGSTALFLWYDLLITSAVESE